MKTKNSSTGLLLCCAILFALPAASGAQGIREKTEKDEVVHVSEDDPAMLAAFDKARATLDDFLARHARPAPGTERYAVKIGIRQGGQTEYFWISDLKRDGDNFSGILANEPRLVTRVRAGQQIKFTRADIYDWTYRDAPNRRTMGNYTACALLTHEPKQAADAFRQQYGLQCD